jgi:hypothetical protein
MAKKDLVNWEAREYIVRERNTGWWIGFVLVVIALSAVAILMKQYLFLAVIVLAAVALVLHITRKPRTLHYSLSKDGLSEGNNLYTFDQFKSFGIVDDGKSHYSLVLVPKKRFGMRVTVFFPESEGEQIVDMFGARLPMEPVKSDLLDQLVRWLRI